MVAGRLELNSRHEGLKQKALIPNSGGTLRLEQQETTEQLKHRGLKQQMGFTECYTKERRKKKTRKP